VLGVFGRYMLLYYIYIAMIGDFNAKHHSWGCRGINSRDSVLYKFVSQNNFKVLAPPAQHIGQP
jgi:hypothetical protein